MIRIIAAISSQALASVATVAISIAVARVGSVAEFGIFSIVVAIWIIVVGSIRAVTGELLVYGHSHTMDASYKAQKDCAQAAAFYIALLVAMMLVLAGMFIPSLFWPIVVLSAGIPAFVAQDNNRFILATQGRQKIGLGVDGLYIVVLVVGSYTPMAPNSMLGLMVVWVAAAWLAALMGTSITGFTVSIRKASKWVRDQKRISWMYFSDFFVANAVANSAIFIVAIAASTEASAAIRGAQVLLLPILLVMRGASVALGPQMARFAHHGPRKFVLLITGALTIAQMVAVLVSWLAIVVTPPKYIEIVLGDSADITIQLFPYAASATLALGSATVAMLALKAAGHVAWSVRLKVGTAPLTLAMIAIGAMHWSAAGSQVALAVGEGLRTLLEWVVLACWYRSQRQCIRVESEAPKGYMTEIK